ncbi:hypothetical protein [Methanococcus voltae]|uniref:Uncharacterized protein n=1 Tax=Methanococcus voltae (strain ATCC BAA-1334 / A3) TaxID=456320 RepID=D7DSL5_METV3|nr:hypothetical protein [Methanococcus voltae]MCS3901724.1 hypothetical protein [Methanococcus voltae]
MSKIVYIEYDEEKGTKEVKKQFAEEEVKDFMEVGDSVVNMFESMGVFSKFTGAGNIGDIINFIKQLLKTSKSINIVAIK